MASETNNQLIREDEDTKEQRTDIATADDSRSVSCFCGDEMQKHKPNEEVTCSICDYKSLDIVYECFKLGTDYHPYRICVICLNEMQDFEITPTKEIHKSDLYFIYNQNRINGPYTNDEIITLYIRQKIKDEIWIKSAVKKKNDEWHKLTFPENLFKDSKKDKMRVSKIEQCATINAGIKEHFPILYKNLVQQILTKRIVQMAIQIPKDIPKERKISKFASMLPFIGKVITMILAVILFLHCLPTMIAAVIFVGTWLCVMKLAEQCSAWVNEEDNWNRLGEIAAGVTLFTAFAGIILAPILSADFILEYSQVYDEIQSWNVAYIVWGIILYCMICLIIVLLINDEREWSKVIMHHLFSVISIIIGVDFGDFSLTEAVKSSDAMLAITVALIFPAVSALLPAAVAGFTANFILEEKFELKCSEDITNTDWCFKSEYGCCDIISSHDVNNSYAFIGGLASNVLAIWAVIRIVGYLISNAFPTLSVYAKRTK
eukprot:524980_1